MCPVSVLITQCPLESVVLIGIFYENLDIYLSGLKTVAVCLLVRPLYTSSFVLCNFFLVNGLQGLIS